MEKSEKKFVNQAANFIRQGGLHDKLVGERDDFVKRLPFLKYITRDFTFYEKALSQNANWFWCEANYQNRLALADEIEKIKVFDLKDKAFFNITGRFGIGGDGYGILVPVLRAEEEPFDKEAFDEACDWYKGKGDIATSLEVKFLHWKIVYCGKRKLPYRDIWGWNCCELLLQEPLNYAEYKVVENILYGVPDELEKIYLTEEYKYTLQEMRDALDNHRDNLGFQSLSAVNLIKDMFSQPWVSPDEINKAKDIYASLYALYEPAEGASCEDKRRLEVLRFSFTKQLAEYQDFLDIDRTGRMKGGVV